MALSNDIVSQFAKLTKVENKKKEETVYGTVVRYNSKYYVKLDGSELLTPMTTTADVKEGERVTVLVKNHTATVTGNISSPAARTDTVKEVENKVNDIGTKISEFEIIVADKISTSELDVERARIDELSADNVVIKETLTANQATISDLQADNITINEKLTASEADIETLKTNKLDASVADITYATITDLEVTNADIHNLEATYGDFAVLTTDKFTAVDASIKELETNKLSATEADLKYAKIDFANIGEAAITKLFSDSGIIKDLVVSEGHITGELVGVTIKGDLIEGNTIVADKLVVKGEDGIYYKLNTDGVTTEAEQTDYNSLNGTVIQAKSITAEKIAVDDLVAFDATIGGFNITDSAIYSGVKSSIDNTTTGVYLDKDGQMVLGDSSSFLKYHKNQNGDYQLEITADVIKFGSTNKTVEDTIKDSIDEIEVGGRNYLLNSKGPFTETDSSGSYGCWSVGISTYNHGITLTAGVTYTVSFDYLIDWGECTPIMPALGVGTSNTPGGYTYDIIHAYSYSNGRIETSTNDGYPITGRIWCTFTPTETHIANRPYFAFRPFMTSTQEGLMGSTVTVTNMKLEIGNKPTDWTPAPEDTDHKVDNVSEEINSIIMEQNTSITNTCQEIILEAMKDYTETGDFEEYKETVSAQLSVMSDAITMNFESTTTQLEEINGDLTSRLAQYEKYITFTENGISIKDSNGEQSIELRLDSGIISFYKGDAQFGWWDGVDFHTGNIIVDVTERAQFGNFAFVPRDDGSLSFLKVSE